MTRFDELTNLFGPWQHKLIERYRQHQMLPLRLAKHFQQYIGCPEFFSSTLSEERHSYVSPARAKLDNASQKFTLEAHDQLLAEMDFHEDGYFYFGLRVFLEYGPNTYPKQPFWFLIRGKFDGSQFFLKVQRSRQDFEVGFDPLNLDPLCEHLFELLKTDLGKNPMVNDHDQNKIGFV